MINRTQRALTEWCTANGIPLVKDGDIPNLHIYTNGVDWNQGSFHSYFYDGRWHTEAEMLSELPTEKKYLAKMGKLVQGYVRWISYASNPFWEMGTKRERCPE